MDAQKLYFSSDYQEGAHPAVLAALVRTNAVKTPGYGKDEFCRAAAEKLRAACRCPDAEIHFLTGGTQTNATVIGACLRSYEGVLAAETGHVSVHEAGAIEFGGHKVLALPQRDGKLDADTLRRFLERFEADENNEHTVRPRLVYLSQPTEFGTLYSRAELAAIRALCNAHGLLLYVDGARLAYALACSENDAGLPDLAALCDVFYVGGTKCGALFGEAVVIPRPGLLPHFFTVIKQHGALLAKGRLLGVQFDALFTDDLYGRIGAAALAHADTLRGALTEKGYRFAWHSPTNQLFLELPDETLARLAPRVEYGFWEKRCDERTVIRLAVNWATTDGDVRKLIALL